LTVGAKQAEVNDHVSFDRRHFLDDSEVVNRSGLRIGSPADALNWFRTQQTSG